MTRYIVDFVYESSTPTYFHYRETGWRNVSANSSGLPTLKNMRYAIIGRLAVKRWAYRDKYRTPPTTLRVTVDIPDGVVPPALVLPPLSSEELTI